MAQDTRNVIDHFKHTDELIIRGDLDRHRRDFVLAFEGYQHDFNAASVLRSANAFLARETWFVGGSSRRWDRRGAVGVQHYEHIRYIDLAELRTRLLIEGRPLVILEDVPDAEPLHEHEWDARSCMLVGAEGLGVSEEVLGWVRSGEVPGTVAYIAQLGSVRSLNAASTASIACFHYFLQHPGELPGWARRGTGATGQEGGS
jgi:tRNA G18 (ribose-2'-O)-methylase SpoU